MAVALTGPFAQQLEAQRERFNARFAQARRERPRLDPEAFKALLRETVAPLVVAVHAAAPERTAEAADALYALALDLLGQDLLGPNARYPLLVEGWARFLPRLARFLADRPGYVAGALTNALFNLINTAGARPAEWMDKVLALAEVCPDSDTLLRAGQAAAWRAGLAHFRLSALDVCRNLPVPVARAALGLAADDAPFAAVLEALAEDPWRMPGDGAQTSDAARTLRLARAAGAFRGFGGLFWQPPRVTVAGDQLYAHCGEESWLLTADAFGATFHRAPRPTPTNSLAAYQLKTDGTLLAAGQRVQLPLLANATSHAATRTTLAVTTPLAHALFLVALPAQ